MIKYFDFKGYFVYLTPFKLHHYPRIKYGAGSAHPPLSKIPYSGGQGVKSSREKGNIYTITTIFDV